MTREQRQAQEQKAAAELTKMVKAKGYEIRIYAEDAMVIADLMSDGKVLCGGESVTIPDALLALYEITQKW